MNRLKQTLKKSVAFGVTGIMLILAGCKSPAGFVSNDNEEYNARMEEARTTPFGAYPETIEYTLGKMTSVNNSNMPENDTYTDNAYTRYIKSVINVQNVDAFEANDSQYDTNVSMAISMGSLPDIMVAIFFPDPISHLGSHSFYISFGSESDTSHRFSFNLDSKTHRFARHSFYHTDVIECILFGIGMRKIIH